MLILILVLLAALSVIGLYLFFKSCSSIKISVPEAMFFGGYGIYLLYTLLMQTFIGVGLMGGLVKVVSLFCLGILMAKELMFFHAGVRQIVAVGALFLFSAYVWWNIHSIVLVMLFALLYCARNISFRRIVLFTTVLSVFIILLAVSMYFAGMIDSQDDFDLISGRSRNSVGFLYYLLAPALFLNVISILTFMHKQNMSWIEWLLLMFGNSFLYYYTGSRLSFFLGMVILLILALYKLGMKRLLSNRISHWLMLMSFPLAAIFSYCVTWYYDPSDPMQFAVNFILEGRLDLGQDALLTYGATAFGMPVEWVGNGLDENGLKPIGVYNWVDCAYIKVMIDYGVVALVMYVISMTLIVYHYYRQREFFPMLVLTIVAVHGIIDDLILVPSYNTFLLLIGPAFLATPCVSTVVSKTYKGGI